jgi:hypothetical protein
MGLPRREEGWMEPGAMIIVLAVVQVIALLAIGVLGWMLARRGGDAAGRARAAMAPTLRVKNRALEGARIARGKSERIVLRGQALAEDLSQKWQTARHLVQEVVHPGRPPVEAVTEPIDRGRRLAQRIARLQTAARKAAGRR